MPSLEIFRTSSFRLACLSGGAFALCAVILFGFVYWQADIDETARIDRFTEHQLRSIGAGDVDASIARLAATSPNGPRDGSGHYGLFAADGTRLAGNILTLPATLPLDGHAVRVAEPSTALGGMAGGPARAAGLILPDGRRLVIARDVAEIEGLQQALVRALEIGVLPAVGLSLGVGFLLSWRAVRRVRAIRRTIERIMSGRLQDRLATAGTGDDFDQLADSVNRMLDEIARLLDEIQGVGDDIAHDLRTPLTRVRTRLERSRQQAGTREELVDGIEAAMRGLDQALGIITALLRIAEIEDGRRRAAFGDVDLSAVARDIGELYEPIAEARGVALAVDAEPRLPVLADRDLLIEAIANVIDNAVKFTPAGGHVSIAALARDGRNVVRVVDSGPGIPADEREAVMKRFYRSDKSRHHLGSGLGLGLVDAIVKLHGFEVSIGDAAPGCIFEISCVPSRAGGARPPNAQPSLAAAGGP
jgi:signal transduction histidine kinase